MRKFIPFLLKIGLVTSVLLINVSGSFAQPPVDQTGARNVLAENYRIGVGDVLDVIVSKNESLSKSGVRVTNQGGIQMPMLETDIPAACLTERELADLIRDKYKKFILEPYVNVAVKEFNSSPVALIGAVNSPGRFQLQRPVRLLELLTFVNGTKETAGNTVSIIRNQRLPYCQESKLIIPADMDDQLISLSLKETFEGTGQANPFVKAGDIIRIDEAEQMQAYIIGNVKSSMTIQLKDPVTFTQAIAMAGGLTVGAKIEKIIIKRRVPGSLTPTEKIINLKEMNQGKASDFLLEPNDIIEVPGPKPSFFRDLMKTFVPSLMGLPLRVIP